MPEIKVINMYKDGSTSMTINGCGFWINRFTGFLAQTERQALSELERYDMVYERFYKNCYAHTSYFLKEEYIPK